MCHITSSPHINKFPMVAGEEERVRRFETAVPFLPVYVLKGDTVLTAPRSVESLNARMVCDGPSYSGKTHTQSLRGQSKFRLG